LYHYLKEHLKLNCATVFADKYADFKTIKGFKRASSQVKILENKMLEH
jgi:hypothetical protein